MSPFVRSANCKTQQSQLPTAAMASRLTLQHRHFLTRAWTPDAPNLECNENSRLSPDGEHVASLQRSGDFVVHCFSTGDARVVARYDGTDTLTKYPWRDNDMFYVKMVWAPDGGRIALFLHALHVWSLDKGAVLQNEPLTLQNPNGFCRFECASWSPDGQLIATGSLKSHLQVWNAVSGKLLHTLDHQEVGSVAWQPCAGHILASAGSDVVRLWDNCKLIHTFDDDGALEWTQDGRRLLITRFARVNRVKFLDFNEENVLCGEQSIDLSHVSPELVKAQWNASGTCIYLLSKTYFHVWSTITTKHAAWIEFPFRIDYGSLVRDRFIVQSGITRYIDLVKWSDRTHHHFLPYSRHRSLIFLLMCIRSRLDADEKSFLPCLPMAMWLIIFDCRVRRL